MGGLVSGSFDPTGGSRGTESYAKPSPRSFFLNTHLNMDGAGAATFYKILTANAMSPLQVVKASLINEEATDSSGAADASMEVGVTKDGGEIVASFALTAGESLGVIQALTIVDGFVDVNEEIWVSFIGLAATEAGAWNLILECEWR